MHDVQSLIEQPIRGSERYAPTAMCGRPAGLPEQMAIAPAARLLVLEALVKELLPAGSLTSEQISRVSRRIRFGSPYELADDIEESLNSVQLDALEYLQALTE